MVPFVSHLALMVLLLIAYYDCFVGREDLSSNYFEASRSQEPLRRGEDADDGMFELLLSLEEDKIRRRNVIGRHNVTPEVR